MTKMYVISSGVGEYSNRAVTPRFVFADEAKAKEMMAKLETIGKHVDYVSRRLRLLARIDKAIKDAKKDYDELLADRAEDLFGGEDWELDDVELLE